MRHVVAVINASLIFGFLMGLGMNKSWGNHENIPILADVVPFGEGDCSFNKKGEMMEGGEILRPCTLVMKPPDRYFAVIFGKDYEIIEVVEMFPGLGETKSVWKKGLNI